jgi:hypothetical protein
MMYRVLVIVSGALALAACSSTPDWMSLDGLKPTPVMDSVRFESTPPGAEVKTSNGQTCRTPCALALPVDAPLTATFTLNGYQPETESLDPIANGSTTTLQPNPVVVELTATGPAPKPAKKPPAKKPAPKKPATAAKPAPAPAPAAAAPQQSSPWPATPAPAQQ